MRKIYFLLLCSLFALNKAAALSVLITESGVYPCANNWKTEIMGMGHGVSIQPVTVLDNSAFFATTDVLIVSDGTGTLTPTQIGTIQSFLQSGKSVYLQSEYLTSYGGNIAFAQIVNALGGTFSWGATMNGQLAPAVTGSFSTTNTAVSSLSYFWYGCTGGGSSNIYPFLYSGSNALGWSFCPPNASYGKLVTTSDQDWTGSGYGTSIATSGPLIRNIFVHLITPGLCGPPGPVINIASQSDVSCYGASNGSATVSVSGGISPLAYSWSPGGGNSASITGRPAGNYTVTVRDASGLTSIKQVTITQPQALSSTGSATNPTCIGTNGSATVIVSGGTPPYTYTWLPAGGTAATATGLTAGSYTVTYTDAKGCSGSHTFTLTAPAGLSVTGNQTDITCNGGSNGTATVSASGGITPYTYAWTSGASAATASGLSAGTHTVTITDAAGCAATRNYNITQPAAISTAVTAQTNVSCSSGSASITAMGGTGTYTYTWSPSVGTAATATGLIQGTYTVTVRDANNCMATQAVTITQSATPLSVSATAPMRICSGNVLNINSAVAGGIAPYTYSWIGPNGFVSTTQNPTLAASVSMSGAYNLAVTDNRGCTATTAISTAVDTIPPPTMIVGNANVCGGTSQIYRIPKVAEATSYNWMITGNGWNSILGNAADTFINTTAGTAANTISVTASNQCGTSTMRTLAVNVTNTPGMAGSIISFDSVCTGAGAVTFATGQINEATSYTWTLPSGWSGTSITNQISATPGTSAATGAITISVTGTNSCGSGPASQKTIIVNNPATPAVALNGPSGIVCAGTLATWIATPTDGGASPLYQWKVNGINQGSLTSSNIFSSANLSAGDVVSVQMKTSFPCTTTAGGWALGAAPALTIAPQVMPGVNINATAPPDLCRGVPVTFYANTTGGGSSPAYHWSRNGICIPDATGANYTSDALNNGDTVRVVLISNAQCRIVDSVASNKMGLSVSPYVVPQITISVNPGTAIGAGQTVIFNAAVNNAVNNPEVRWKRNGQAVAGTTKLSWTTSTLRDGDVVSADLVSGAQCTMPFLVSSTNTLQMRISTGVGNVATGSVGSISLYPSPNNGRFTVKISKGNIGKQIRLEVLNAAGQVVSRAIAVPDREEWSTDINAGGVAAGWYALRLSEMNADGSISGTSIKQFEIR